MPTAVIGEAPPREVYRGVAGQLVTGVAVVVTMAGGEPLATTAGSVVAASWEPPLLAVLFRAGSRMDTALIRDGRFTVNILGQADSALAQRFARPDRGHGWASLADVALQRRNPAPPILSAAVAWADCAVVQTFPIGDHRCFVGELLDAGRDQGTAPLAYYRGRFRELGAAVAPAGWAVADEAAELAAVW